MSPFRYGICGDCKHFDLIDGYCQLMPGERIQQYYNACPSFKRINKASNTKPKK